MSAQHLILIFNFVIWTMLMASVESQIDGFKLVYMWPVSYCHREQNCSPDLPEKFTIHGLWAFNSSGMINCPNIPNPIPQLKTLQNSKLENELDQIWINHRGEQSTTNNYMFWDYEWYKHSSCLNLGTRVKYFQNVSNFHNLLVSRLLFPHQNLFHLLSKDFPPGGHYKPQEILNKIYTHISLAVELKCSKIPNVPVELWEVSFCLNVEGSFVTCNKPSPKLFYQSNECNRGTKGKIYFPKLPSNPPVPTRILKSNAPPPPPTRSSLRLYSLTLFPMEGDLVPHPSVVGRRILWLISGILFIGLFYIVRLYFEYARAKFVKKNVVDKST